MSAALKRYDFPMMPDAALIAGAARGSVATLRFPIMKSHEADDVPQREWIPWSLIAPHDKQAQQNHGGQTLVRLAQRGGLDATEAVAVLEDADYRKKWPTMPPDRIGRRAVILSAIEMLEKLCASAETPNDKAERPD